MRGAQELTQARSVARFAPIDDDVTASKPNGDRLGARGAFG
jgi:hypothetical protein